MSVKRYIPSQRSLLLLQADAAEDIGDILRISAEIDSEDRAELQRQINEIVEFMRPTWDMGVER